MSDATEFDSCCFHGNSACVWAGSKEQNSVYFEDILRLCKNEALYGNVSYKTYNISEYNDLHKTLCNDMIG